MVLDGYWDSRYMNYIVVVFALARSSILLYIQGPRGERLRVENAVRIDGGMFFLGGGN